MLGGGEAAANAQKMCCRLAYNRLVLNRPALNRPALKRRAYKGLALKTLSLNRGFRAEVWVAVVECGGDGKRKYLRLCPAHVVETCIEGGFRTEVRVAVVGCGRDGKSKCLISLSLPLPEPLHIQVSMESGRPFLSSILLTQFLAKCLASHAFVFSTYLFSCFSLFYLPRASRVFFTNYFRPFLLFFASSIFGIASFFVQLVFFRTSLWIIPAPSYTHPSSLPNPTIPTASYLSTRPRPPSNPSPVFFYRTNIHTPLTQTAVSRATTLSSRVRVSLENSLETLTGVSANPGPDGPFPVTTVLLLTTTGLTTAGRTRRTSVTPTARTACTTLPPATMPP